MFCFGLVFPITLVSYSCYTLSDLTAISEVARRMLHTSRRLEDSSWMESLEDLTQRMVNSDHRPTYIRTRPAKSDPTFLEQIRPILNVPESLLIYFEFP